jgi:hypothetical protein
MINKSHRTQTQIVQVLIHRKQVSINHVKVVQTDNNVKKVNNYWIQ